MKDYYKTLGVSHTADIDEIKKAFRRLAIAYHPDHNSSKEAESFIKEVIEAYDVLENPEKRTLYDSLLKQDGQAPDTNTARPHRDPRYRRRAAPNPDYKSENQEMIEMMRMYLGYAMFVSWCTLAFSLFLVCDFCLKPHEQTEVVRAAHTSRRSSDKVVTDKGNEFRVGLAIAAGMKNGESITVSYSPWLMVPLFFRNDRTQQLTRIPATIYGNFIFGPVFLLGTSLTGVVYRRGTIFRFNLGIVNFLLFMLNVVFLLIHHIRVV